MISTALTRVNELVIVDTDLDILFARSRYNFYYSDKGAVYMTLQDAIGNEQILKRSVQEIKECLAGAEILDPEIMKKVLEMLSE